MPCRRLRATRRRTLHCATAGRRTTKLQQAFHQRQADPESALSAVQPAFALREQFEGVGDQVRRHADAVVAHRDHEHLAFRFQQHIVLDVQFRGRQVDPPARHPRHVEHLVRNGLQHQFLLRRQALRTRCEVEHAQGAERHALGGGEQFAGIEAQPRRAGHQRIAFETGVEPSVGHDHRAALQQRELADRVVQRHLARARSSAGNLVEMERCRDHTRARAEHAAD
jgi:hypothetical protein